LGARVKNVDLAAQRRLALPGTRGALVLAVHAGSLAERAGLKPDAVIVGLNGQRVEKPEDMERLLRRVAVPGKLEILCYLDGRLVERTVEVTEQDRQLQPRERAADTLPGAQPSAEERIAELERRVQQLEARLAELERMLQEPAAEPLP
jgi:predicted metalloprotease with PDZ domain